MTISGMNKLTLLDYPGYIACIIFTQGCNLKCPFCQNSPLIENSKDSIISEEEIISYLEKRKKLLDGIVISGGEPTVQKDLIRFIKRIKEMGFKIKLDTNGINPKVLKELLDLNLLDYVAMDIKNTYDKYSITCGIKNVLVNNIKQSIELLKQSNIDYEFRTTIMKEYHDINDIIQILNIVGESKYFLQNFKDSENVLDKNIHGFTNDELLDLKSMLDIKYKNVEIRGLNKEKIGGKIYV